MTMIYHTDRCHQLIAAARAAEKRDLRLSDAVRSSIFLLHNEAAEELPLKSKRRKHVHNGPITELQQKSMGRKRAHSSPRV